MTKKKLTTFTSPWDFTLKFFGLFKGPTLISAFLKTEKAFREKIFLTVAMKNNCYG